MALKRDRKLRIFRGQVAGMVVHQRIKRKSRKAELAGDRDSKSVLYFKVHVQRKHASLIRHIE